MVFCMKTTMNLDNELVRQLKLTAAHRGTTVTALVEEAVRASLLDPPTQPAYKLDLPIVRGARLPAIDPGDRQAQHDFMEAPPSSGPPT